MDAVINYFSTEPGRFFFSLFVTAVGFLVFFRLLKRPKSDLPPTWAQSMAGAMAVFAMFLMAYGVVPHEWLTWADSKLGLREDKILLDTYALDISGRALRDTVAAGFYIVFLGLNIVVWSMWQKRGMAKPKTSTPVPATPSGTSAFSRPVTKKD
ncbi:MAG TPA: hypothetical protein VG276_09415 [Actinomycetes bacterium]|nr:hypothetical protein [Actinomycetes bacterium]